MTKDFPYMRKYNYMRNFVNQKTRILQPSGIRKFFDIVREMEGAISLGVGEPDFVTPWPVRSAANKALSTKLEVLLFCLQS